MVLIRSEDSLHKSYLNRLLVEIIDCPSLAGNLIFKGGTCAAMLGFLDRFSVDLDFDVKPGAEEQAMRVDFKKIFKKLALIIDKENPQVLEFLLKYPNQPGRRNSLKLSALNLVVKAGTVRPQFLPEIDRLMICQTIETMFANKLVAITNRYDLHQSIAGRDLYDIHHFFLKGYRYHEPVILERTGLTAKGYFVKLSEFIRARITGQIINEDLNALLPNEQFQSIRKILVPETLSLLEREITCN